MADLRGVTRCELCRETAAGHHCSGARRTQQERSRPRLRRLPQLGPAIGQTLRDRGPAAFESHSRRPDHNPGAVGAALEDQFVRLRKPWTSRAATRARPPSPNTSPAPAPSSKHVRCPRSGASCPLADTSSPSPTNGPARPGNASNLNCPINTGRPMSPTSAWPTTTPGGHRQPPDPSPPARRRGHLSWRPSPSEARWTKPATVLWTTPETRGSIAGWIYDTGVRSSPPIMLRWRDGAAWAGR